MGAVAALVVLGGCAGSDDGTEATTTSRAPAPSTSAAPASSTVAPTEPADPALAPAVEPREVPDGFRALRAPGIGVGVAVPEAWTVTDLRGDDLTEAQAEAAATDPQLSGLLADGGALLDDARALAALGPSSPAGTPVVTLIQLDVVVDEVPPDVEAQVRRQVEGYGAADVRVGRVAVAGRAAGAMALEVRAVLTIGGVAQQLVVQVVPTALGLAVVTVRAESGALDVVLRSLAAS